MKRIGIGRTAEVYDHKDNKVLKLFYSTVNDKDIEYEYLITKSISAALIELNYPIDKLNVQKTKNPAHARGRPALSIAFDLVFTRLKPGKQIFTRLKPGYLENRF